MQIHTFSNNFFSHNWILWVYRICMELRTFNPTYMKYLYNDPNITVTKSRPHLQLNTCFTFDKLSRVLNNYLILFVCILFRHTRINNWCSKTESFLNFTKSCHSNIFCFRQEALILGMYSRFQHIFNLNLAS